jgi:hypothetical protein
MKTTPGFVTERLIIRRFTRAREEGLVVWWEVLHLSGQK